MNNLLNISRLWILSFFVVLSSTLFADSGVLKSMTQDAGFTVSTTSTSKLLYSNDVLYTASGVNLISYNSDGSNKITTPMPNTLNDIVTDGTYIFMATSVGIRLYPIDGTAEQNLVDKNSQSIAISTDSNYAFLGTADGVSIFDISTKTASPIKVGELSFTDARDLVVYENYLYVADDWGGLKVVDISNPENSSLLSSVDGKFYSIARESEYLYALGDAGLSIFDISSPAAPIQKGATFFIDAISTTDSLDVDELYAYISTSTLKIYDVSNPLAVSDDTTISLDAVASVAVDNNLYIGSSTGLVKYFAETDFKDTFSEAVANPNDNGFRQASMISGVSGVLSANDDDYLKLLLPSGRFIAEFSGMANSNITLYNLDEEVVFNDNSISKIKSINIELAAAEYYLHISSPSSGTYTITSDFLSDDWTDSRTSATLLNFDETVYGNLLSNHDADYFRVDLSSKGYITIESEYEDVLDFEIYNSYDNTIITGDTTPYINGKKFLIPNSGTYFLRAMAANQDVENNDYRFRPSFSSSELLAKEDDAELSLKAISSFDNLSNTFMSIKSEGKFLYTVNSISDVNYFAKRNKSDLAIVGASISLENNFQDFVIVGDYIYILYSGKVTAYNKNLSEVGSVSYVATSGDMKKIHVNADRMYIIDDSNVIIFNIEDRSSMSYVADHHLSYLNDFDFKTSYRLNDDETYSMHTYLYLATQEGLLVVDVTNDTDITLVQTFKEEESFGDISISGHYAYLEHNSRFDVIYIKRPTYTPKVKSYLNGFSEIKDISINQNYAYVINGTGYLHIIDIEDKTAIFDVELSNTLLKPKAIVVDSSVAYTLNTTELNSYDVSTDYGDNKGNAGVVKYDEDIYGRISENRVDDIDIFYISPTSSMKLTFIGVSDAELTYKFFTFNNDTLIATHTSSSKSTNFSISLSSANDYYVEVSTTTPSDSGSYSFRVTKQEDDHGDTFTTATPIELGVDVGGSLFSTGSDRDFFKIVVKDRAEIKVNVQSTIQTKTSLYYDDGSTLIKVDTSDIILTTINPGTYYVVVEGDNATIKGDYSLKVDYTPTGELTLPTGIDEIVNFDAVHVLYGSRYIYVIRGDENLLSYNHLLKTLDTKKLKISDEGYDLKNTCGKVFLYKNKIFLNTHDSSKICNRGYIGIPVNKGSVDYHDLLMIPPQKTYDYTDSKGVSQSIIADEVNIIDIQDNYVFEYAKDTNGIYYIFKSSYDDISGEEHTSTYTDEYGNEYETTNYYNNATLLDKYTITASLEEIGDVAVLGSKNYIAINDVLNIYDSGSPVILQFLGNISTLYADKNRDELYVIDASTKLKRVFNSGSIVAQEDVIDLGGVPNGMYENNSKLYISLKNKGIRIYDIKTQELKSIDNIGKNIAQPFSYDGSTINYTSENQLRVFFIEDSFVDGSTAGTYSVIDSKKVSEGSEGCFIATAAYGSYFSKNVKILRDFRDEYLLTNTLGREFVRFYYATSPAIAQNIATSEIAKGFIRVTLTPIVYAIKYPFLVLLLLVSIVIYNLRKKITAKLSVLIILMFSSLMFNACSSDSKKSEAQVTAPVLKNFITNIDTNNTGIANISLGSVDIESFGGAEVLAFRLDGAGRSNFSIDKRGVIRTHATTELNCIAVPKYNFNVFATNSAGDSKSVEALVQVNCLDAPVTEDYFTTINEDTNYFNNTQISFKRKGLDESKSITEIRLYGKGSERFNISTSGIISLNGELDYEEQAKYDLTLRAINSDDIIGPHTRFVIDVWEVDEDENYDGDSTSNGNDYGDDYPGMIEEVTNTTFYDANGHISSNIDFDNDMDIFRVEVSDATVVTANVNAHDNQNVNVSLQDEYGNYFGGNESSGSFEIVFNKIYSGYYYLVVSGFNTGGYDISLSSTVDTHGDNTAGATDVGLIDLGTHTVYGILNNYEDEDYIAFTLDSTRTVTLKTTGTIDTYGNLYDSSETTIRQDDNSDPDGINFNIVESLSAGTYYIEVSNSSYSNGIGDYILNIEVN